MHFVIVFIQGLPNNEDAEAGRSGNETSPLIEKPREVQLGEQMLQLDSCLDNCLDGADRAGFWNAPFGESPQSDVRRHPFGLKFQSQSELFASGTYVMVTVHEPTVCHPSKVLATSSAVAANLVAELHMEALSHGGMYQPPPEGWIWVGHPRA